MAEVETKEAVQATIFEPHGGYPEFGGEPMPFGYLSIKDGPAGLPFPVFALEPFTERPVEELAAYARVACAGPDLLASCRALVAAMRKYEVEVDGDAPTAHIDMMTAAEAAIQRAEA